ncbi:hypothetical protein TRFO_10273 [Tritrichomonas foetus]|uniref:Uncharacterized protein n=1 Tax=Tritrichomonas foetus TaxID=1144522 RepID=A0A1J4JF33_9EUKA|nr:hypothetical protein TRFO_10273 [Tritrichomonas foetus]|eukprot:OHS95868.1 hypothetical protein TRFO_10273 [Tritrichomonas foetus]
MSRTPEAELKSLSDIMSTINSIFQYDPNLVFSDSFERIKLQLNNIEDLINETASNPSNYWVIYNIVISILPICERIIFAGYSDHVLEFLLLLNNTLSSILIFCTSRFIPFRLQVFTIVCSAFANTEDPRDKDADQFVHTFKNDINQLKQLEECNVNGLAETIKLCDGTKCKLSDIFQTAATTIELMAVHFNVNEEIVFERVGSANKQKRKPARPVKEEPTPQVIQPPPPHTINLIANAFNSPLSKNDYLNKYGQAAQAWTNPECQLAPSLLHRLIFSFLKAGNALEGHEALAAALPDDLIVQLATAISTEDWLETSNIMEKLPQETISTDFQFFNEIALKIWKRFCANNIDTPSVLKGVLHVMFLSPAPCPMQTAMVALHYCWYLDEQNMNEEAAISAQSALKVMEEYRDIFTIRKFTRVIPSSTKIPNKPLDQGYLLFEKWLECLHTDLLTIWIKSKLKHGLKVDTEAAKIQYAKDIENTKAERIKAMKLYGKFSIKQKEHFDNLLNRQFKPPSHSTATEQELMDHFKNNNAAKALLYTQMAFFRPSRAASLLEKARQNLTELEAKKLPLNSPVLYVNRTEIGFLYPYSTPGAKKVAIYGKETVGSSGLTLSNVALSGTGIKQDVIDPFIVTKLKPNTLYSFGFGAFDSLNELIDNITEPFSVTTCHDLSTELAYCYLASASYRLKDMGTFDVALSFLLNRFVDIVKVNEDHAFYQQTNPFNKFMLKTTTFSEPAPLLRAFSSALMMAARLFAAKPIYATSFQRIAVVLSQILHNHDLTLQICHEMFAILQPLLVNIYHTQWVFHPLLYIIDTLKHNKNTAKTELHQNLSAQCAYAFENILVQLYQEKQLSSYIMKMVVELPPNLSRSAFMMFASKNQLLEANVNDTTLPLCAAEMFRTSPEKSYDELFNKFKLDPQFPAAAVFLVSAAHNAGLCSKGVEWCNAALDYIKSTLHENDEKQPTKKANSRAANNKPTPKRRLPIRGKKNEMIKQSTEDATETIAATKIISVWNKYQHRRANIAKFDAVNKYRAALNLLLAMCLIEQDQQLINATTQETSRTGRKDKTIQQNKGRASKHSNPKRATPGEEDPAQNNQSAAVISALRRAIVIGARSNDDIIIKSAATFFHVYISTISPGTSSFNILSPLASSICQVLIYNLPLQETYSQDLLRDVLIFMMNDNQINNIRINLQVACKFCQLSGQHLWILSNPEDIPPELHSVQSSLQQRDPAENQFYEADTIYQRAIRSHLYPNEPANNSNEALIKGISEIAVALQHKQKLSMSVCLLSKLAFILFDRNETALATTKLCEALECHFRLVRAHEKVDQILKGETEASFYQKHSWSGCMSIFVISSLISLYSDRVHAMQLSRLAAFSISAIFSATPSHPQKQIDFADFEPSEIIQGVDIFSEYDPHMPLLEPAPALYMSIAISNLISSLLSYEMYFEMFKPLSFARHFYRFIVREKRGLARARLFTIMACTQFGILQPAIKIINDIITNYGEPRITKESSLYPASAKKIIFEVSEPPNSPTNLEAARTIATPAHLTQIMQNYGSSIMCHYVICVSRILQNIALVSDPSGSTASDSTNSKQKDGNARGKHRGRQHHGKKDFETSQNAQLSPTVDSFDGSLRNADMLLSDVLSKELKPEQALIKLELQLEKAMIYMGQWRWEDAIRVAQTIIKSNPTPPTMNIPYIDRPMLLASGLVSTATQIIANASYNLHDYQDAQKVASPYMKCLLLIHKADYEGATQLLTQIALHPPITAFHREYVLSVAQLVSLFCFNPQLYESIQLKLNQKDKNIIKPVELITQLYKSTYSFFTEQLGMNEGRSYFIRDTHLLVRIKHLQAEVNSCFNGLANPIELLADAQNLLTNKCPYIAHGLAFLLNATCSRIQMQSFLAKNPTLIQYWNHDINPLSSGVNISPDFIEKLTLLLHTMFAQAPDCVVHPESQQSILDFAVLAGVSSNENGKRLEQSLAILSVASAVRSSRRFIQSLIAQSPDAPPSGSCPFLLLNDHKDQKLRGIAAAYYSHVCSLDLPFFDTEIYEMRTLLYFKCFEEQCTSFKSLQQASEQLTLDAGQVVGQWYQVDSKIFKLGDGMTSENVTIANRSSTAISRTSFSRSSRTSTTASGRRGQRSANLKGSLYFFIGVIVDLDEAAKKKPPTSKGGSTSIPNDSIKLTPLMIAAQQNDLRSVSNEMSEVGLELEEATRMESSDAQCEAPPQCEPQETPDAKRKRSRQAKSKAASPEVTQNVSLLKNQAQLAMKNAEIKWKLTLHKAESIFNKSNRIISFLVEQRNRWPTEVKMDAVEMSNATTISHFFNTQYGINEKSPQLAEWLCQYCTTNPPTNFTSPRVE